MNALAALTTMRPPAGAPASAWAARITACWRATVEGVLEVGRLLEDAKGKLDAASFELMIERDLPFTASTARRLIAIGSDPRLSDRAHVHKLPNSWGTLYELTKLTDEQFGDVLSKGIIRPDVERTEIVAARKALKNAPGQQAYIDRVAAGCTLAELHALAAAKAEFGSICADPNWHYETYSEKGQDRSPSKHYKTDPLAPIKELPVARLAAKNSILHLWCMDWLLPGAIEVIDAWGFKLINVGFVWKKLNPSGNGDFMGLGHWTRNGAELCLLATKGHPVRRSAAVRQVIEAPIGKHSEKPDEFYRRVEALAGGPFLDLYARQLRDRWTCWGNEIPRVSFKIPTIITTSPVEEPPAHESRSAGNVAQPLSKSDSQPEETLEIPAFLDRKSESCIIHRAPVVSPRMSEVDHAEGNG